MEKYNSKRLIDLDYLKQDFYKKPKQIHADLIKIIKGNCKKYAKASLLILDVDGQFFFMKLKIKISYLVESMFTIN